VLSSLPPRACPSLKRVPGDLIYFYNPISHVGLYIGNGQMVHAPNTGSVVHVRSVNWGKVVGVTRPG
jgi:peptidoglycan DL-endopeptidase CwlO